MPEGITALFTRIARAFTIVVLVTAVSFLISGCSGPSELKRDLDALDKNIDAELIDATDVSLRHISKGMQEGAADMVLREAGFLKHRKLSDVPQDTRSEKSEYYLFYSLTSSFLVVQWTTYDAVLGINGGVVDFINVTIWTSSF